MNSPTREAAWREASRWEGTAVSREVFTFPSGPDSLYGSLYATRDPNQGVGAVIVLPWGYEATRMSDVAHEVALAAAGAGGAGLVFHHPGHGDSLGDLEHATLDAMMTATLDAVRQARDRVSAAAWILVGFRLGASVAALVAEAAQARGLLLFEPELDPSRHFEELLDRAHRMAFQGDRVQDVAFGFPVSTAVRRAAEGRAPAVASALASIGEIAVIRYASSPRPAALPAATEEILVPGTWNMKALEHDAAVKAMAERLGRFAKESA